MRWTKVFGTTKKTKRGGEGLAESSYGALSTKVQKKGPGQFSENVFNDLGRYHIQSDHHERNSARRFAERGFKLLNASFAQGVDLRASRKHQKQEGEKVRWRERGLSSNLAQTFCRRIRGKHGEPDWLSGSLREQKVPSPGKNPSKSSWEIGRKMEEKGSEGDSSSCLRA